MRDKAKSTFVQADTDRIGEQMQDKFLPQNKAYEKYTKLARFGLQYVCVQALLALRRKLSASGYEAIAVLAQKVSDDVLDYEKIMMRRLLSEREFIFWSNWS